MSGMYLAGDNSQRDLRQWLRDLVVAERADAAADALAAVGAPAVAPLLVLLNHPDPKVRGTIHDVLIRIGEPAIDPFCNLLCATLTVCDLPIPAPRVTSHSETLPVPIGEPNTPAGELPLPYGSAGIEDAAC